MLNDYFGLYVFFLSVTAVSSPLPTQVIKDCVRVITSPLTNLFNNSVEISQFPDDLKYANISPLFKNDESTLAYSLLFLKYLNE